MAIRKNSTDSYKVNPLTGSLARPSLSNSRVRTNLSSIYNRGNPFSPILEETSEDSSRSSAHLHDSPRNLPINTTFTRSPGAQLAPRRKFDFSFSSDSSLTPQKSTFEVSTQTDSFYTHNDETNKTDCSIQCPNCLLNKSAQLDQAFVDSKSAINSTSESLPTVHTQTKLLDANTLQIWSELLLEAKPTDGSTGAFSVQTNQEGQQLRRTYFWKDSQINYNVKIGCRRLPKQPASQNESESSLPGVSVDFTPPSGT